MLPQWSHYRLDFNKIGRDAIKPRAIRQAQVRERSGARRGPSSFDDREQRVLSFEDFVEQSQQTATGPQLRALFEDVMADEGFENYLLATLADGRIRDASWVRFPEGHFETYIAEGWERVDPVLAFMARARRPFFWDDVAPGMRLEPAQIALLEECKRVGVHSVTVVPFQSPDGRCDIIGVSRRHAEPLDPARLPILQAMCAQAWCRYSDLAGSSLTNESAMLALTDRELEILKWIKDGKSNTEISEIVSLSVKTIEYHVGNILRKLGASNRTTAVVIAIKNKLLAL